MNKKKQLIEYIIQDIIVFIIEDNHIEMDDALIQFYNSKVFEMLHDLQTELYLEGSAYVYDLFLNEKENGKLIQKEI